MIRLIACIDLRGNIGKDNELLFSIPQDMKFFKEKTIGYNVLMGINTWDSLPDKAKPLPLRHNIVVCQEPKRLVEIKQDVEFAPNLETHSDLETLLKEKSNFQGDILYVIGGASVYNWFIDRELIDEAYLTIVYTTVEDADATINIERLIRQFNKRDFLKTFEYNGMGVEVCRLYKE